MYRITSEKRLSLITALSNIKLWILHGKKINISSHNFGYSYDILFVYEFLLHKLYTI